MIHCYHEVHGSVVAQRVAQRATTAGKGDARWGSFNAAWVRSAGAAVA